MPNYLLSKIALTRSDVLVRASSLIKKTFISFLFLILLFALSSKSVFAATYYVRADGTVTAASKASATSSSSASTSLNMAQVKLATFAAGDQVLFSSQGGNYAEVLILPSGGSGVGNEITYKNVTSETPVIAITSGYLLQTNSKSNVIIEGLTLNYTGSSASTNIGTLITAGSNIKFKNVTSNMGGYGYVIYSNSALGNITFDSVSLTSGISSRNALNLIGSSNSNITIINSAFSPNVAINNGTNVSITNSTSVGILGVYTGSNVTISNISQTSGITLTSVTTATLSNVTGASGTGFIFTDSSGITVNDSSMTGSTSYGGFITEGTTHDVTYNRTTANNNTSHGFVARGTSNNIIYYNCVADNNLAIGFLPSISATNITYRHSEASYNGTVNVTADGGGL